MLSKNQVKFIRSLKKKKFRQTHRLFLAEGVKVVGELTNSKFRVQKIYCTASYEHLTDNAHFEIISEKELKMISDFSNPNQVIGLFHMPPDYQIERKGLSLALDEINDPGNLGTIIRLCDWFGVRQLICSENTVDCYNPKVIQASMGSLSRVEVIYTDLGKFLGEEPRNVYGTFLKGENIYGTTLNSEAVLVMGNEANGISDEIQELIANRITIPRFGENQHTESLNVATATAICLSEFRR